MSRARILTREDLITRYATALRITTEDAVQRAHGLNNDSLRDVVEQAEHRPPGRRPRWAESRPGQTTTAHGQTR